MTMSDEKEVIFPNELLEEMNLETTIFSQADDSVGIAAFSELQDNVYILRLYHLLRNQNMKYHLVQELAAFSFQTYEALKKFLDNLPKSFEV